MGNDGVVRGERSAPLSGDAKVYTSTPARPILDIDPLDVIIDYDYFIDAVTGDDANDGTSEATAWQSLESNLTDSLLTAGETTRVLVKAGTYVDQALCVLSPANPAGSTMEIYIEPGVTVQWTLGTSKSNTEVWPGATLRIFGNGARFTGFNAGTGDGVAANGGVLEVHDVVIDDCVDGASGHGASVVRLYDCHISNCTKSTFAHIDTTQYEHYRCTFDNSTGSAAVAGIGLGGTFDSVTGVMEECEFIPPASGNGRTMNFVPGTTIRRSKIGTLAQKIAIFGPISIEDSFINVSFNTDTVMSLLRVFGKLAARQVAGGSLTMDHCVITAPSTGNSNILYSNFDSGGGAQHLITNCIFETGSAGAFMSYDATNAGYLDAAGSEFHNNCLSGSAAYDADLIAADSGGMIIGTVSDDALIGVANTDSMADYAFAAGSPCIGAATDGGNIGFGASEVVAVGP